MKICIVRDGTQEPFADLHVPVQMPEDAVQALCTALEHAAASAAPVRLPGYDARGGVHLLPPEEILRIYALQARVLCHTQEGEYTLRLRIFEAEELLAPFQFLRISSGELVNSRAIRHMDATWVGHMTMTLTDGTRCFVSRRQMPVIRRFFGIGGKKA